MFSTSNGKYFREGKSAADRHVRQCMKEGKDIDLGKFAEENNSRISLYDWQKSEFERGVREVAKDYGIPMPPSKFPDQTVIHPEIKTQSAKRKLPEAFSDREIESPLLVRKNPRLSAAPNPPVYVFIPANFFPSTSKDQTTISELEDEAVNVLVEFKQH